MLPFETFLKYPIVLLVGLVVSLLVTRTWGPLAPRFGFVDRPGARKLQKNPVPTAGGIALFCGVHAACLVLLLFPWRPFAGHITLGWWGRFAVLSSIVVLLGIWDDKRALSPICKLAGQVLIAVLAFMMGVRFQNVLGISMPVWLNVVLTVGWFLVWMNAFNLIDGIDGLATGIALIAAIGLALSLHFRKSPGDVLLLLGFIGACAGFLRYNFYPARVFLGDTGSLFLGFTLAMLAITTHSKGTFVAAIGMPLLAAGIPLFDSLLAIWRRAIRGVLSKDVVGAGIMKVVKDADAEHLHHRLLKSGLGQRQVALLLYAGTAGLVLLGLAASLFHDRAIGILALGFMAGAYVIVRHLAWIELRETGEAVLEGVAKPVRRNMAMLFYIAFDLGALAFLLLITETLLGLVASTGVPGWRSLWVRYAPLDVVLPFIMLVLFRAYTRVWYLARVSEFLLTGVALVLGYACAFAIRVTGGDTTGLALLIVRYWLLAGAAVPIMVGIRASRRILMDSVYWAMGAFRSHRPGKHIDALICGSGWQTTLFLRYISDFDHDQPHDIHFNGIVDPDTSLRGHYVHGIRVLGAPRELPALLGEYPVDVVYLVGTQDTATDNRIRQVVRQAGKQFVRWSIDVELPETPTDVSGVGDVGRETWVSRDRSMVCGL